MFILVLLSYRSALVTKRRDHHASTGLGLMKSTGDRGGTDLGIGKCLNHDQDMLPEFRSDTACPDLGGYDTLPSETRGINLSRDISKLMRHHITAASSYYD